MPYLQIKDQKYGMDRRRKRVSGVPGTLWTLKNAHFSRGGDIERAKKFVPTYDLPAGLTFGLAQVRGQLFTFGSGTTPGGMPLGVQYQQLAGPAGTETMTRVLHASSQSGKLYVIASFDDGNVYHFYNGSRVTDWDALAAANASAPSLAAYLSDLISADEAVRAVAYGSVITITAREPGTAFTISASATNNGADNTQSITLSAVQANVAEVAEVRATAGLTVITGSADPGVNYFSDITLNGTPLTAGPVDFLTDINVTASRIATAITSLASTHGYTAEAVDNVVTITAAPGTGSTPNGYTMSVTNHGTAVAATANMGGGVTAVEPVAQIHTATIGGLFEADDLFTVTINGIDYKATGAAAGTGTYAFVYKRRTWSPADTLFEYSKLEDPSDWNDTSPTSGSGFILMTNESEGSQRLVSAAQYGQYAAIFSDQNIRLYTLDTDPANFSYYQTLDNTGTIAPRSVVAYGNNEVFYLDITGIRSLRARDSLNIISVNDIGTAVDTFVRGHVEALSSGVVSRAVSVIEPVDGRFWIAIGDRIYSLSYFPSSKITAWSYYEPGFSVSDFCRTKDRVYARAGDTIYLYGGEDGQTYPEAGEQVVTVETPFMASEKPATFKGYTGFDIACENVWAVYMLPDPNDETDEVFVGNLSGTTFTGPSVKMPGIGMQTHVAFRLVCNSGGNAVISSMAVHYLEQDAN